jgi:RNA polymerase sigma-70 factor, ECF subfamily
VAETLEDTQLVDAARDGDRTAFGLLYQRYARVVHGILLARVPPGDTDDLTQDVFLLAMRRLHTLRDPAAFPAWLAAIARNRTNDYYRRSPRHEELTEAVADAAAQDDRPQAEAHAALAAIRSLPDAYRETLILRLVEGLTGPEIAERTGLTHGSVRVNLFRGMQMLRNKLEGRDQKSEEKF